MRVRPEDLARNMRQLFDAGSGVGLTDGELLGRLARRGEEPVATADASPIELDDLRSLLHAEVSRLPAKYRAPIVLCYFEGRTHEEAAGTLHWPVGTVRGRLARARDLLRSRLTRRGLAPAVAIGAATLERSAHAEVDASLRDATVAMAIRGAPAGASVAALTEIVLRSLIVARLKISAVAVLTIALFGTGAAAMVRNALAVQPPDRSSAPMAAARLERAPTALVDRFGDPLPTHARARMGTLRFRHGDLVANALFTSQGRLVASVGASGAVHVWDAATGRKLREIGDRTARFLGIALSSDGNTLATIADPGGLRFWDLATGREQRRWHETKNEFYEHMALSPDGRWLRVSTSSMTPPRKKRDSDWDTVSGHEVRRLRGHLAPAWSAAFTTDGRSLISASADGTALVWDVSDLPDQPKAAPLPAAAFKDRWAELASSDARVAYRASWALSAPSAVPFLRDELSGTAARAYRGGGITEGPVGPPAVLRMLRAIAALERVGTPEAQGVLDRLAHGDSAALVTNEAISALARLKNRKD